MQRAALNVGVILIGAGAFSYWERRKNIIPIQVRQLVNDAALLEDKQTERAQEKWVEAASLSHDNNFPFKIQFNILFALACNYEKSGEKEQAILQYKKALACFPDQFDFHSLPENTRLRVSVALDRLAQDEQERQNFQESLFLYDRALDVLATPDEVNSKASSLLNRPIHLEAVAGILNNVATLFADMGMDQAGIQTIQKSDDLMKKLPLSRDV